VTNLLKMQTWPGSFRIAAVVHVLGSGQTCMRARCGLCLICIRTMR